MLSNEKSPALFESEIVYFTEREFNQAEPSCHISDMSPRLMARLVDARKRANIPFHVNSAYRPRDWELLHGRDGKSSHTKGLAIDIRCTTSDQRLTMLKAFIDAGFRRIGIYKRFIHVDVDVAKPNCIWLG